MTDAETRDVALMVLAGIVNKSLVAAIAAAGRPAIGLCGGDGGVFRARKKQDAEYDLGFVGEICFSEPRWLKAIWAEGGVPVLSSVALGGDGQYYNVNADQMAAACAIACEADALIFLTDVAGVKQADGAVMPRVDTKQRSRTHRRIGDQRRHDAEARGLHAGSQKRCRARAHSARVASRNAAAVLFHQAGLRYGGAQSMSLDSVSRMEAKLLLPTYERQPILFERGRGVYLWDSRGKRYLDFLSGIGVNALGHNHPAIQAGD